MSAGMPLRGAPTAARARGAIAVPRGAARGWAVVTSTAAAAMVTAAAAMVTAAAAMVTAAAAVVDM